jgi:HTH-type transcriptional regulator/antitoxin HipB
VLVQEANDFGIIIRERRLELGWSLAYLARTAGVSRQWLIEVERGKKMAPVALVMKTLAVLSLKVFVDVDGKLPSRSEAVSLLTIQPNTRRKDSHPDEDVLGNDANAPDEEDTATWPPKTASSHISVIGEPSARSAEEYDARLEAAIRSGDFMSVVEAFLADLLE